MEELATVAAVALTEGDPVPPEVELAQPVPPHAAAPDEGEQALQEEATLGPADGGGAKRRRGAAKIEKDLAELRGRLAKKTALIQKAQAKGGNNGRDVASLKKWKLEASTIADDVRKKQTELESAQQVEDAKALREAAQKRAAADREEANRHMSEAGALLLVELVMKAQSRLNNTSDKTDAVWESDIHHKFMLAVKRGELPEADGRSAKALKDR